MSPLSAVSDTSPNATIMRILLHNYPTFCVRKYAWRGGVLKFRHKGNYLFVVSVLKCLFLEGWQSSNLKYLKRDLSIHIFRAYIQLIKSNF